MCKDSGRSSRIRPARRPESRTYDRDIEKLKRRYNRRRVLSEFQQYLIEELEEQTKNPPRAEKG